MSVNSTRRSLRLLSNASCPDLNMFCITLVRMVLPLLGPISNACKKPTRINACLNLDIIATSVVFRQQNSNNSTQRNQCVSTKSQRTSSNRRQKTPKLMSLYKTLHSASTFQNIDVQKNVLGQLANGKCPPLCPIKKIWPFYVAKVTTFLRPTLFLNSLDRTHGKIRCRTVLRCYLEFHKISFHVCTICQSHRCWLSVTPSTVRACERN